MTKNVFIQFYDVFTSLVKQNVLDRYVMNASAHLIEDCGGYELELHPDCLMFGDEIVLINSLCNRFLLTFEIYVYSGTFIIR